MRGIGIDRSDQASIWESFQMILTVLAEKWLKIYMLMMA